VDGSGTSNGETCLEEIAGLSRSFLLLHSFLLPNKRKTAPQIRTEVGRFGRNLDRLPVRFSPQPPIEFFRRSMHAPTLAGDWHAGLRPPLGDGGWLPQKSSDLLAAFNRSGSALRFAIASQLFSSHPSHEWL
jgi:hypothetical protein